MHCFAAYPEMNEDALAVVVIHENPGLTDWVRSFADQLAGEGFVTVAPDLLSGFSDEHMRTSDIATSDDARSAIYELDSNQVMTDLLAVQARAAKLNGTNGQTAVVGFCWGGSQSSRMATSSPDLLAALVFYGSPPLDSRALAQSARPVYRDQIHEDESDS